MCRLMKIFSRGQFYKNTKHIQKGDRWKGEREVKFANTLYVGFTVVSLI